MKLMLFICLLSSIAKASMSPYERSELARRIELYGLGEKSKAPRAQNISEEDTAIIATLQADIRANYIPKIENQFGNCDKESCIIDHGNYLSYEAHNKKICLPFTRCGFYECMEEKYQCKSKGVNYFTDLATPTCNTYVKNVQNKWFSNKGLEWVYTVMVCLQKGLVDECDVRGKCSQHDETRSTCDYITDYTLKFHPTCYLNSGVGICNLPLQDKINIWRTVAKYLTSDERRQAYNVVLACIKGER